MTKAAVRFMSIFCLVTGMAAAQLPVADLTRIVPRAIAPGKQVRVNCVGQHLEQLTTLHFTHPGITAARTMLPATSVLPARPNANFFEVSVAADVPPGIYEARVDGHFGLSTARPFIVSSPKFAQVVCDGRNTSRETALNVEVNSVVSGDIPSRREHWFRIDGRAGQRILIEAIAERIDSRIDSQLILYDEQGRELDRNRDTYGRDALVELRPQQDGTWYVSLSDILFRGGGEHFYRLRFSTAPHVDFISPAAGIPGSTETYTIYGRNLPGSQLTELSLNSHPLESLQVEISLPATSSTPAGYQPGQPRQGMLPGFDYRFPDANSVRIGFATTPVTTEERLIQQRPADEERRDALQVEVPLEVSGWFDASNDEDVFRFAAAQGETWYVELTADRMGYPVDTLAIVERVLTAEDGTESLETVAENDDLPSLFSVHNKDAINFNSNDSALSFTAKEAGNYQVRVVNQFGDGGSSKRYRLAIRKQTPDFQLIASTERPLPTGRTGYSVTPHLRKGARWGIRIVCPRQDAFDGDIVVTAEGLPDGVTCRPLTLSQNTDHGLLVVTAAEGAGPWAGPIRIIGRAQLDGQTIEREARFSCLVWGHIFADSIRVRSRLTQEVPMSVSAHETAPVVVDVDTQKLLSVHMGEKLEIPVRVRDLLPRVGNVTVEVQELYGMDRGQPAVSIPEGQTEGVLAVEFKPSGNFRVAPGRYQFALQATGVAKYRKNYLAVELAQAEIRRLEDVLADVVSQLAQAEEEQKVGLKAVKMTAETELATAKKALASAEKRSAETNTKFAAWSELLSVEVLPAKK